MERLLARIAWFVGLTLAQVMLLNNLSLFGLATPFIYVYFVLVMDKDVNRIALMAMSFAMGLVIDVFSNTPGVNAGALVFVAFLRPILLRLFSPREEFENFEPGIYTLGFWPFVRYAFVVVLFHHTVLFFLEAFSFVHIEFLLFRVLCSTFLTLVLVMTIEFVRHKR